MVMLVNLFSNRFEIEINKFPVPNKQKNVESDSHNASALYKK